MATSLPLTCVHQSSNRSRCLVDAEFSPRVLYFAALKRDHVFQSPLSSSSSLLRSNLGCRRVAAGFLDRFAYSRSCNLFWALLSRGLCTARGCKLELEASGSSRSCRDGVATMTNVSYMRSRPNTQAPASCHILAIYKIYSQFAPDTRYYR